MRMYKVITERPLLSTLSLALLLALVVYGNFISTGTSFLFAVSDAHAQVWPYMVGLAEYIRTEGFPMWSFSLGLGSAHHTHLLGNPFTLIPILIGKDAIPHLMVFMHLAKIVLACLFFYLYLKKLGFKPFTCSITSLLYAFSGIMITRGFWYSYGTECVYAALLLYALELYLKDKKCYLLPIPVCLIAASLGAYYVYLYSILGFLYLTIRYIYVLSVFKIKQYVIYIGKSFLLILMGIFMSGATFLPYIYSMFQSARVGTSVDGINAMQILINFFNFDTFKVYISEFYRFFSPDILGVFSNYSGVFNYLEGPLFYCGISVLLLLPFSFIVADSKKTRWLFVVVSCLALSYLIFPTIHIIMSGFIHGSVINANIGSFKLSSLWISIIILVMFGYTINKISLGVIIDSRIINLVCGLYVLFLVGFLYVAPDYGITITVKKEILLLVLAFLLIYTSILPILSKVTNGSNSLLTTLFCVIVLELFMFSSITVRDANYIARQLVEYMNKKTGTGYFDIAAVNYIKSMDDDFFRIDKKNMVYLGDPLFQGYYGSSYYESFPRKSYVRFLSILDTGSFHGKRFYNHSVGLTYRPILGTLTGFKYIISNKGIPPFGYEHFANIGDKNVFRNKYTLPLGFAYDKYITEEDFSDLAGISKDLTLLNAVVVQKAPGKMVRYNLSPEEYFYVDVDKDTVSFHDMIEITNDLPSLFSGIAISHEPQIILPVISEGEYYTIEFDILSEVDTFVKIFWDSPFIQTYHDPTLARFNKVHSLSQPVMANEKTSLSFEIIDYDVKNVRLDPGTASGKEYVIENLRMKYRAIEEAYVGGIQDRKQEAFNMDKFSQNHITGTIETTGSRMLFFSIPYDRGWMLKIDGKPVKIEHVNIGFIGAQIDAGLHQIELKYRTPGLIAGIVFSFTGLFCFIIMIIFWRKA